MFRSVADAVSAVSPTIWNAVTGVFRAIAETVATGGQVGRVRGAILWTGATCFILFAHIVPAVSGWGLRRVLLKIDIRPTGEYTSITKIR